MPSPDAKRIAVIGNSHAACIKTGWDEIADDHPEFELTFFCARNETAARVNRQGNTLVPKSEDLRERFEFTSGGLGEIDLDQYDEVLIYGMRAKPFFLGSDGYFSPAVTQAALEDATRKKCYYDLVELIHDDRNKPIHVGHEPLHAARGQEDEKLPTTRYHAEIDAINELILGPFGAKMWPQPEETIANGVNTCQQFAQGSVRLQAGYQNDGEEHKAIDRRHMNKEFGVLWLKQFFANN